MILVSYLPNAAWKLVTSTPRSFAASVNSLDKQIQNEKELNHLASAGGGGLFCICVESINLTWLDLAADILCGEVEYSIRIQLSSGT